MKIKFSRKLADPAYIYDAGIDLPCPKLSYDNCITTGTYDLGISVNIPQGYFGLIFPRSSFARKGGDIIAVPIDSGYTGPLHAFVKVPRDYIVWEQGIPFCQLVIIPCINVEPITDRELQLLPCREDNWAGSSNKNYKESNKNGKDS